MTSPFGMNLNASPEGSVRFKDAFYSFIYTVILVLSSKLAQKTTSPYSKIPKITLSFTIL